MTKSRSNSYQRSAKNFASGANKIYHHADRAASSLGRWITTDHSGIGHSIADTPYMGFMTTLKFILARLLIGILSSILVGVLTFALIAYGMPALISALLS
jgi:hypothetical protein